MISNPDQACVKERCTCSIFFNNGRCSDGKLVCIVRVGFFLATPQWANWEQRLLITVFSFRHTPLSVSSNITLYFLHIHFFWIRISAVANFVAAKLRTGPSYYTSSYAKIVSWLITIGLVISLLIPIHMFLKRKSTHFFHLPRPCQYAWTPFLFAGEYAWTTNRFSHQVFMHATETARAPHQHEVIKPPLQRIEGFADLHHLAHLCHAYVNQKYAFHTE
jgi:hypothetical protein